MKKNTRMFDVPDAVTNNYRFRKSHAILPVCGLCFYLADMGLDASTAYTHYYHHEMVGFILTVFFITVPSIIVTILSMWWDSFDLRLKKKKHSKTYKIVRFVFSVLQISPVVRYVDSLRYGFLSRQAYLDKRTGDQKTFYMKMLIEQSDCVLLRLIEGFLEAIPQLIIQLYMLCQMKDSAYSNFWIYLLWLKCLSSLITIAWGVTAYSREIRYCHPDKKNISYCGSLCLLIWQLCIIGARVVAFVICSMEFHEGVIALVVIHCFIMGIMFIVTSNEKISPYHIYMCCILALMSSFSLINNKDGKTRNKYIFYYILCTVENAILMGVWLVTADTSLWYYHAGVVLHYTFFVLGVLFMLTYYVIFHPAVGKLTETVDFCDPSHRHLWVNRFKEAELVEELEQVQL